MKNEEVSGAAALFSILHSKFELLHSGFRVSASFEQHVSRGTTTYAAVVHAWMSAISFCRSNGLAWMR